VTRDWFHVYHCAALQDCAGDILHPIHRRHHRKSALQKADERSQSQLEFVICEFLPALNIVGETRYHGCASRVQVKVARFERILI
jgi:hypothetical protein